MLQRNPHRPWFQSHLCWETWDQPQLWQTLRWACSAQAATRKVNASEQVKLSMSGECNTAGKLQAVLHAVAPEVYNSG